jgi:hypothetical protein
MVDGSTGSDFDSEFDDKEISSITSSNSTSSLRDSVSVESEDLIKDDLDDFESDIVEAELLGTMIKDVSVSDDSSSKKKSLVKWLVIATAFMTLPFLGYVSLRARQANEIAMVDFGVKDQLADYDIKSDAGVTANQGQRAPCKWCLQMCRRVDETMELTEQLSQRAKTSINTWIDRSSDMMKWVHTSLTNLYTKYQDHPTKCTNEST